MLRCECEFEQYIPNCPTIDRAYEINRRFVFVMRSLGLGYYDIRNFCGFMDLGVSISKSGYYTLLENIFIAARAVSQMVLRKAAKEEQEKNEATGNVKNHLSVSGDGSWAKCGFTSLVGIVSLVGKRALEKRTMLITMSGTRNTRRTELPIIMVVLGKWKWMVC